MPAYDEKLIRRHMNLLGLTRAKAIQLIEDDKKIDRGEPMPFDATKEQLAVAKKMRNAGTRVINDKEHAKRTYKENPTKSSLIEQIVEFLNENNLQKCENVEVLNKERLVAFEIGGEKYEITLIKKRKPKK